MNTGDGIINSVHEAQGYEDSRQTQVGFTQALSLPLESRREVTQNESWDDAVSLEEISQASRTLGSMAMTDNGTASSLAVDSKLVFVGMTNSAILMFDHFGVMRGQLDAPPGRVTSLDSWQNSMLLAGYDDGRIILWDCSNSQRLLDVTGPSESSIVAIRWYRGGQSCLSVDAMGVANLYKFSKTFLLNSYMADRKLLLDGRTRHGFGPIFSTRVLTTDSAVGLALSVTSFTLIVRLEPEPTKITSRWELPAFAPAATSQMSPSQIPCLAYHATGLVGTSRVQLPTIARCFQNAVAFSTLDQMLEVVGTSENSFTTSSPTLACEWISDCCISLLDSNYQLSMLDTQTLTIVGKCDATGVQFVQFRFVQSHPDLASYENCLRTLKWSEETNSTMYLLGLGELVKVGIQPWALRVDRLVKSGQWLEALTLSLKYFRTVLLPLEEAGDDFRSAGLMTALRDGSKVADLLLSYLAFNSDSLSADVGAVCIEYAVSIKRVDLVFEVVFETFTDKNKSIELMSVLYPFVIAGKIDSIIPPVVFDCLVQYVSTNANAETLEAMFLSLRTVPADLDGSIRLCKEKRLFSALCRLYNYGLNDFVAPVQVVLAWMGDDMKSDGWKTFGYRLVLYLSYCFLGVEFPKGTVPLSPERADIARDTLLGFFFPSTPTKEPGIHRPLFVCLDFDATAFLKGFEQAHSLDQEHHVFRWLVVAGLRSDKGSPQRKLLLEFVVTRLASARKSHTLVSPRQSSDQLLLELDGVGPSPLEIILTPALAEALFREMYFTMETQKCIDLVERFATGSSWFLQQLAVLGDDVVDNVDEVARKRRHLVAVLSRINLKASPNEFTFGDALDAYLNLDDEGVVDFVREQRERLGNLPYFSKVVASRAKRLLQMNTADASSIIFSLRINLEGLVKELQDDPALQFALLKPLVGASAFGEQVTLYMVEKFVELLCDREPSKALDWLAKNEGRYPLDAALDVCRSRGIKDATAYLLERAGRVQEALDLVLEPNIMSDAAKVEASVQAAITLCVSFSQDKGHSDMWIRVLDFYLEIRVNDSNLQNAVDDAISRVIDSMMPYISLAEIIEKVRELDAASPTSRPALQSMLESLKRESTMFELADKSFKHDLVTVEQRERAGRIRGSRITASALLTAGIIVEPIARSPPGSVGGHKSRRDVLIVNGFENYDTLEACWEALSDPDPQVLGEAMLKGTVYEMQLYNLDAFRKKLTQLADAGL